MDWFKTISVVMAVILGAKEAITQKRKFFAQRIHIAGMRGLECREEHV